MTGYTSKITRQEMISMFGESMPIEAMTLLWEAPNEMTIGEIRAKLRQMVPVCQKCGQHLTARSQYDCPSVK